MYKLIIFDVDGTLIDTEITHASSLQATVRDLMGREMSYEEAYEYFGHPSAKVASLLGYAREEQFAEYWEVKFREQMNLMTAFPGVEELLEELSAAGRPMGIVTSRSRIEYDQDPVLIPMHRHFKYIVCAEDAPRHKPFPDPVLECIRLASENLECQIQPSEVLYIGDTMFDYKCATDAGCDFVLVDWRKRGDQGIPATLRFTSASEISELVKKK